MTDIIWNDPSYSIFFRKQEHNFMWNLQPCIALVTGTNPSYYKKKKEEEKTEEENLSFDSQLCTSIWE